MDYSSVKCRDKKEFIGYEISNARLRERSQHHFILDSFCRLQLEMLHKQGKSFNFVIGTTAAFNEQNALINRHTLQRASQYQLMIKYIQRRKQKLACPNRRLTA